MQVTNKGFHLDCPQNIINKLSAAKGIALKLTTDHTNKINQKLMEVVKKGYTVRDQ